MTEHANQRHRVVVIGGGFGGLAATRALADADVEIAVVDRTNHHLFQPLLYQVATGILPPGLIAPAIRSAVGKQRNARVLLADVKELDLDRREVHAFGPDDRPLTLPYDTLIVAAGATHAYFGRDEWAEFAPGMKSIEDARHVRSHILSAFEMAEMVDDPAKRSAWLTFVVVGAGPTGVELAGQVAELAHQVLPRDYRSVDTRQARIILVEGTDAVLGPFDPKLRAYTQAQLEKKGVEVRLKTLAVEMDHESVTVRGPDGAERIPARTRIWAAGVRASPLATMLAKVSGADLDRAGRVAVGPDCTLPGHSEVFAIGDMISLNGLPGVAQPAIQEGKYVASVIRSRLAGRGPAKPFVYFDKGSMATIGFNSAVASAFGRRFTGFPAYVMWIFIHVLYLIGWGNRLGTLYTWVRGLSYARNRAHRLITYEQAHDELEHEPASGATVVGRSTGEPTRDG
jgi:NADH:ubiquinone reductase (H+-translocating)